VDDAGGPSGNRQALIASRATDSATKRPGKKDEASNQLHL